MQWTHVLQARMGLSLDFTGVTLLSKGANPCLWTCSPRLSCQRYQTRSRGRLSSMWGWWDAVEPCRASKDRCFFGCHGSQVVIQMCKPMSLDMLTALIMSKIPNKVKGTVVIYVGMVGCRRDVSCKQGWLFLWTSWKKLCHPKVQTHVFGHVQHACHVKDRKTCQGEGCHLCRVGAMPWSHVLQARMALSLDFMEETVSSKGVKSCLRTCPTRLPCQR
jgi:hypothetical protein